MVAAQQQGTAPELQLGVDGFVHGEVPGEDLGQMAVAVNRCQARVGRAAEVASIDHVEAQAAQHRLTRGRDPVVVEP